VRRFALIAAAFAATAFPAFAQTVPLVYPDAPRGDVVDTYWGTKIADPYRWLETVDSTQSKAWIAAENALTRSYLDAIPQRSAIRAAYVRQTRAFAQASAADPPWEQHGRWWVASRRTPTAKSSVLFVRASRHGTERVLLDQNALPASEGIEYQTWSPSGKYLAYATKTDGSEWLTWRVRDVARSQDLSDVVRWGRYVEASFAGDSGFYYSGYDTPGGSARNEQHAARLV
jgi:prolyl oligopeptidase